MKSSQLNASSQSVIFPSCTSNVPRTQNDVSHFPLRSTSVRSVSTTFPSPAAWWMVMSTVSPRFSASSSIAPTLRPVIVGSPVLRQTTSSPSSATAALVSGRASRRKNSRTVCSGAMARWSVTFV